MTVPTLDEMAQAIETKRVEVEEAARLVEARKRPYHAAIGVHSRLRDELKAMRIGLDAAKKQHAIRRALEDAGIETSAPAVILVPYSFGAPWLFEMVAVGGEGTALYLHRPERSGRYSGKEHAIGVEPVPDPDGRGGHAKMLAAAGLKPHEGRGKGQWGAGSGSMRPLPPPEGGKWRWLKVREQEALAA